MNGEGTYKWANGIMYEGEFREDIMDGYGVKGPANNTECRYEG